MGEIRKRKVWRAQLQEIEHSYFLWVCGEKLLIQEKVDGRNFNPKCGQNFDVGIPPSQSGKKNQTAQWILNQSHRPFLIAFFFFSSTHLSTCVWEDDAVRLTKMPKCWANEERRRVNLPALKQLFVSRWIGWDPWREGRHWVTCVDLKCQTVNMRPVASTVCFYSHTTTEMELSPPSIWF